MRKRLRRQCGIDRAGRLVALLRIKAALFALAGLFAVSVSGLALLGVTTSADANTCGYTLLSIAGVILGGGEFMAASFRRPAPLSAR